MKIKMPLLFTMLAVPFSVAMAQDKVVAPSPSSRTSLDLYEQPGATQSARQISVSEAGLPLAIQATQTGYYKVAIAGRDYWLRGMQVRVHRATNAGCTTSVVAATGVTIATPGAGKDACN